MVIRLIGAFSQIYPYREGGDICLNLQEIWYFGS